MIRLPRSFVTASALTAVLSFAAAAPAALAQEAGQLEGALGEAAPQKSKREIAEDALERGHASQRIAADTEAKLAATDDPKKRAKLEKKVGKSRDTAIENYELAIKIVPTMHEAWSALGGALLDAGRYGEAVSVCTQALSIDSQYGEAIEYRIRGLLGLGRIEEAVAAYGRLKTIDPERAATALAAMKSWAEARQAEPDGTDPAAIDAFAHWLAEQG